MSDIPNTKEIQAFMHCSLCIREGQPQSIEAGWTRLGFQVWCRNHDCNITHIDFEGVQHKANLSRKPTAEEVREREQKETH